jgi:pilus assembly protein CpaC
MKTLLITFCLLLSETKTFAAEKKLINQKVLPDSSIVIEMGEDYKIKKVSDKIWIENLKTVKAEPSGSGAVLKPQSVGSCKIRIDSIIKTVSVLPPGYKSSYELWQKLSFQFPNIHVGFCDNTICLDGSINTMTEFEKLVKLMRDKNAALFLGLKINTDLKKLIEDWYAKYFRENSITPLKIVFTNTWKVFLTAKEDFQSNKDILQKVGLHVIENKQKLEIADNVRVKIQITEVKKELTRSLGIKWPEAYDAKIMNGGSDGLNPFDLQLRSYEKNGDMKVLASPNLICRNGKSAEFFAGGEFPIVTKDTGGRQTVVWKKYGIELKIKPQIDSIGQMSIELETEISSIDKSREVNGIPAIHDHKVLSHFDLIQSKTIALSGLIKNETGTSNEGLPFLGQIPILGKLFSSEEFLENRTELVIFVTPELMEP